MNNFDLDMIVYGTYTLKHALMAGGGVVGFFILIFILRRLFGKKEDTSKHDQTAKCARCGWNGKVSRYSGRCPSCNNPLGDRKAWK